MLNAVAQPIKHLLVRAELKLRSAVRALATRRLERLYGSLPAQPSAPHKGAAVQAAALTCIVETHCAAGTTIVDTHSTAGMHLEAAEYAFSMMIAELRDVMVAPEISWTPRRRSVAPQFVRVADAAAKAA